MLRTWGVGGDNYLWNWFENMRLVGRFMGWDSEKFARYL